MIFFYSGADIFNQAQLDIDKSIGGLMSSTPVPNNMIENLFAGVSKLGLENQGVETKGIFLKNLSGQIVKNLFLYEVYPEGCIVKLEWAAASSPDGKSMEKIGNMRSNPYYATFSEPAGVSNKILLTHQLEINGIIALWVRRTILPPAYPACDSIPETPVTKENITVSLRWYDDLIISTTTPLPAASNGVPYNQALTLVNGNGAVVWTVSSGALPDGLIINSTTGVISGTPTANNTFNFSIHVIDSVGLTVSKDFSIVVS